MHDAFLVRSFERFCDLSCNRKRLFHCDRTTRDSFGQGFTRGQFHHEQISSA